ncbi:MAG: SAM-dependent methyltransferase [archaeon]|nr:SAM-dependent methyltransferase [archaeon]
MIKLSYNIDIYRKQLLDIIQLGDTIIELGAHIGNTSKLILEKYDDCTLISLDNSQEAIEQMAKISNTNFTFIPGDVRLHDIILEVYKITKKCDVLSVDLGGGYHPDTVFKVFYIWASTFKPKHTLIRNKGLLDFSNSIDFDEDNFKSENGYLSSYGGEGIPPQIKEFDLWTNSLKNK